MNPFERKLGPEEQSQIAVAQYLSLQYPDVLWFHSPQETYTKSAYQKWKNRLMGVKKGVPDILICENIVSQRGKTLYCGLAIEMKYGKNKCTPEQLEFLALLSARGWRTHVCYSSGDAIDAIDDYLKGHKRGKADSSWISALDNLFL